MHAQLGGLSHWLAGELELGQVGNQMALGNGR